MLVIAIIMPTIVADIGGAAYYTWAAMLYTIGAILGGASTGVVWARLGARRGYAMGAGIFALGTVACAVAPDIGILIAARTVQGWAGGLVAGSGMALITSLYSARLRTRIIAISQGTFTACHLSGPVVGGMFAAMHWWRGSFWAMAPFMLAFAAVAYAKIPEQLGDETARYRPPPPPLLRLAGLAAGVCCVAAAGPVEDLPLRLLLIAAGIAVLGLTFRFDRRAANNLFPAQALSLNAPIGLGLWILALHGMTQTSVNLFLPLLLQVVHGVSPVFVNFLSIIISCGWTIGTFTASGWSGIRERAGAGIRPGARLCRLGVPDPGRAAAPVGLAGGEHVADGSRHWHLQRAFGGPHDGQRRNRRAAQPRRSADLSPLARYRLRRGDCGGCRQHRRARGGDGAAGGRSCGDDGLSVLLGAVRSCRDLYVPLHPLCTAATGIGAFSCRLMWPGIPARFTGSAGLRPAR
jgi:MFS family permease